MKNLGTVKSSPRTNFIIRATSKTTNALVSVHLSVNRYFTKDNGSTARNKEAENTPTSKKTSSTKASGNAIRNTAKDTSNLKLEYTMACSAMTPRADLA